MKTCPICSAIAFDDQQTCFGCMHSYAEKPPADATPSGIALDDSVSKSFLFGASHAKEPEDEKDEEVMLLAEPACFMVAFTPRILPSGKLKWECSVEPSESPASHRRGS